MYLPSNISTGRNTNGTPLKYTVRARDAIHQTLFNNSGSNNGINNHQPENKSSSWKQPSILKYGSSPLLNSINASQLTFGNGNNMNNGMNSNNNNANNNNNVNNNNNNANNNDQISIHSGCSSFEQEESQQPIKKKKKIFGFNLMKTRSSNELHRTNTMDSMPSSTISQVSDSLFSRQLSHQSAATNATSIAQSTQTQLEISLEDALPSDFKDIYSSDTLVDTLPNGRPKFTQRDILDWQLNDVRSLLIRSELKKEWMDQIPMIRPVNNLNFKIQIIPLTASDDEIIQTLVESDIYKETNFHLNFKIKTLTYIVNTVRNKHLQMLKNFYQIAPEDETHDAVLLKTPLLKYELRNIIENYLLNLGVESQCRANFKKNCLILKKQKFQLFNLDEDFDKNKNLLKTALINNSNFLTNLPNIDKSSIKLSRFEKLKIWNQVQVEIYKKLNLDWQPDNIA